MRSLSLKDRWEMRRMGYRYRVFFRRPNGVPFYKDFTTMEEKNKFVLEAEEAGCRTEDRFEI